MSMSLYVNKFKYADEVNRNTGAKWDGISMGLSVPVQAGDFVHITFSKSASSCSVTSIDQGFWGRFTAVWYSESFTGFHIWGHANNTKTTSLGNGVQ